MIRQSNVPQITKARDNVYQAELHIRDHPYDEESSQTLLDETLEAAFLACNNVSTMAFKHKTVQNKSLRFNGSRYNDRRPGNEFPKPLHKRKPRVI